MAALKMVREFTFLSRFNAIMAALHALQGGAVLWLSTTFALPVMAMYLQFNPAQQSLTQSQVTLFELPLAWLVAAFLFLSSFAHLWIVTVYKKKYEEGLQEGINRARWWEYSLSASTMMVAISMLAGVYELGSLIMIFALTAGMNLMGLVMEHYNRKAEHVSWLSFWIGTFLGLIPWVVVGIYFWATATYGAGADQIPTFVYWIYGSIFAFFNVFAINMWLQYKKIGPWKDYIYGEKMYILLSLIAKSLLAWQVFAGTLRPN
jgi:uncharacterized membrane protein YdcZ (DUF606 family)